MGVSFHQNRCNEPSGCGLGSAGALPFPIAGLALLVTGGAFPLAGRVGLVPNTALLHAFLTRTRTLYYRSTVVGRYLIPGRGWGLDWGRGHGGLGGVYLCQVALYELRDHLC